MCIKPSQDSSSMPGKKITKPREDKLVPGPMISESKLPRKEREGGLSGQRPGSALAQMLEQERVRTRRPEPNSS
jgi:hypothetical protein